jgi:GNAT superfamily N-acetyltransferase
MESGTSAQQKAHNRIGRIMSQPMTLRLASRDDIDTIAAIFSPSVRLLNFLPSLHSWSEDRWFIDNILFAECVITLAEMEGRAISFLARAGREIRLLHTHPDFIGLGTGAVLIEHAKSSEEESLFLWCFQANHLARKFYERHGFRAVEFTDGQRNEEKTPDVRYVWER